MENTRLVTQKLPKKLYVCSSIHEQRIDRKEVTNIVKQSYRKVISLCTTTATKRINKCTTKTEMKANKNREIIVDSGEWLDFVHWGDNLVIIGKLGIVHIKKQEEVNGSLGNPSSKNVSVNVYEGKTNMGNVTGYELGIRLDRKVLFILFFYKDCDPFKDCPQIPGRDPPEAPTQPQEFQQFSPMIPGTGCLPVPSQFPWSQGPQPQDEHFYPVPDACYGQQNKSFDSVCDGYADVPSMLQPSPTDNGNAGIIDDDSNEQQVNLDDDVNQYPLMGGEYNPFYDDYLY